MKYNNILDKFEFEGFRTKSRSTWLLLENYFYCSNAFICRPILILLHKNVLYDNILNKLELETSRAKV